MLVCRGQIRNSQQMKARFRFFPSAVSFNLMPEEGLLRQKYVIEQHILLIKTLFQHAYLGEPWLISLDSVCSHFTNTYSLPHYVYVQTIFYLVGKTEGCCQARKAALWCPQAEGGILFCAWTVASFNILLTQIL